MIWRSLDERFLQQIANQLMAIESCLRVEFLVANFAQKVTARPVLLKSHFEFGVVHDHMAAHLELTNECLAADVAVVIFLDIFLCGCCVLMNSGHMTGDYNDRT